MIHKRVVYQMYIKDWIKIFELPVSLIQSLFICQFLRKCKLNTR